MCCCFGPRVGSIVAGVFFLIESVFWLAISVVGLMTYGCKVAVGQDISAIIYYIYFYNEECTDGKNPQLPGFSDFTLPDGSTIPPDATTPTLWPEVVEPSERTQRWALAYVILSGIWALTAILLIVGCCWGFKGFHAIWYYMPCVLTTAAVIIADTVASIIYGLDVPKTETVKGLMEFIGVYDPNGTISSSAEDSLGAQSYLTVIPSVVMVVIFCRGIILWIINLIVFINILMAMTKTMLEGSPRSPRRATPRRDSTESDDDWSYGRSGKRSIGGVVGGRRAGEVADRKTRGQAVKAEDDEDNSDFLRVLSNHNEVRSSLRENGMPPTELRSQLPWSYFSSRDEPARPPKPTKLTKEPMPPVPPPDYTLRFPQAPRPSLTGGPNVHQPVSRNNSNNISSTGRSSPLNHHPHGRDLAGATPVFPSAAGEENPYRRVPPEVPPKSTNLKTYSGGNWIRRAPGIPQGPQASSVSPHAAPQPMIPEPDYSKPAMVPYIPSPDYSNPVGSSGESGAVWRQKPLHTVPHVITKTPSNIGRTNENGYY